MDSVKQTIRGVARGLVGATAATGACLTSVVLAPSNPAPAFAFLCLIFAGLSGFGGRYAVLSAVGVGALELAFILPGQGFAVANPDDALALIGTIGAGLLIAWRAGSARSRVTELEAELHASESKKREATLLLEEVAHRVVNDFAILSAHAAMTAHRAAAEETRAVLADLKARLVVLGRMYRHLRIDRRDDGPVAAAMFLTELCGDLQQVMFGSRPMTLRLAIEPVSLPREIVVVVGLILNELLTNVHKHAFPDERCGTVSVLFARHAFRPDRIQLVVSDDGVGFVRRPEREETRGWRLVDALAAQLDGDVSYARIDGSTIATLEFPAPPRQGIDRDRTAVADRADIARVEAPRLSISRIALAFTSCWSADRARAA
jgi:two-component sensor histidine kinase